MRGEGTGLQEVLRGGTFFQSSHHHRLFLTLITIITHVGCGRNGKLIRLAISWNGREPRAVPGVRRNLSLREIRGIRIACECLLIAFNGA